MAKRNMVKAWLARLKFVNGEYPFLAKPGPAEVLRDDEDRLHSETTFAYRTFMTVGSYVEGRKHGLFADRNGSMCYYFRDVLIPSNYFTKPEELEFEDVIQHTNAEVRRVGCELYGFERMLKEKRFKILDEDKERDMMLLQVSIDDGDPLSLIRVSDAHETAGYRKKYFLCVPPDMKTARQAVAWTFYKDEKDYAPKVEA